MDVLVFSAADMRALAERIIPSDDARESGE